jgi:hypothetical protein
VLSLLGCPAIGLRGLYKYNTWEFCFGQGGAGAQFGPHCAPSVPKCTNRDSGEYCATGFFFFFFYFYFKLVNFMNIYWCMLKS